MITRKKTVVREQFDVEYERKKKIITKDLASAQKGLFLANKKKNTENILEKRLTTNKDLFDIHNKKNKVNHTQEIKKTDEKTEKWIKNHLDFLKKNGEISRKNLVSSSVALEKSPEIRKTKNNFNNRLDDSHDIDYLKEYNSKSVTKKNNLGFNGRSSNKQQNKTSSKNQHSSLTQKQDLYPCWEQNREGDLVKSMKTRKQQDEKKTMQLS